MMVPHITCQTILVPATSTRRVEQGFLILAGDVLMVVVMHLDRSVDDPDLRGHWFPESGYGPCAVPPGVSNRCCSGWRAGTEASPLVSAG
jgi:hypothetical protein